jgi:pimeloyl-ACP methyl ester carboxylesterase
MKLLKSIVVMLGLAAAAASSVSWAADDSSVPPALTAPSLNPSPKKEFEWSDVGNTPYRAARLDPRMLYTLFVPRNYDEYGTKEYWLIVVVHGTERDAAGYRSRYAKFAEDHDAIVLAPLFAANTQQSNDLENYKLIDFQNTRYDLVLLSMVDEIASKYRLRDSRFLMFGFSGGGHFAHRFLYLHPHRLLGVSIGAPGVVTLLDDKSDWWIGVRDVLPRFGVKMNLPAMRKVPVQMVVGANDNVEIPGDIDKASAYWMGEGVKGAHFNAAGKSRVDRMVNLKRSFEAAGINVRHDIVPGAAHESEKLDAQVQDFFGKILERAGKAR